VTNRVRVMQLTDTLDTGGYERVAVNLGNVLPRNRYEPYLCTTRREGSLAHLVRRDVEWLKLNRRHRFDVGAVRRLVRFIQVHKIELLHAHDSSLFIACLVSLFPPYPAVLWHVHFGEYAETRGAIWSRRLIARLVAGIIVVNQPLLAWSRRRLGFPAERVWYIPNFVCVAEPNNDKRPILPGTAGARIVCVANLRVQKDHLTLLRAMALVVQQVPAAHLLLVGGCPDEAYRDLLRKEIQRLGLDQSVSLLGERQDVSEILLASDIGALSSKSEGLPLALLEYGMAKLPAVATNVGQCSEVLDEGRAGILVPPGSQGQLAEALVSLLESPHLRLSLGNVLFRRVRDRYSSGPIIEQVSRVYDLVLNRTRRTYRLPCHIQ